MNSFRPTAILSIFLASSAILGWSGCAATDTGLGDAPQALVCPECKMVAETVERSVSITEIADGSGQISGETVLETVYTDTCPGCQGAIKTFFKEGQLRHKCSVCKDSPFTCPVFHPIDKD